MPIDILIAGAGPAGCAASVILTHAGHNVYLVNKKESNLFKVGESILPASVRLLYRLGIKNISDLLEHESLIECASVMSAWNQNEWHYNDSILNPEGNGWQLDRLKFDRSLQKLAIKSGTQYIEGMVASVKKTECDNLAPKFLVEVIQPGNPKAQTIFADWLIDASGRNFSIGKRLHIKREKFDEQMAIVSWIYCDLTDQEMSIRVKSAPEGWWYSSQLPDKKRVIAFHSEGKMITEMVRDKNYFLKMCNQIGLLAHTLSVEQLLCPPVAVMANVTKACKCVGESWLAVGDAALSFDPLSSQGIFFALYSGIIGAESIINSTFDADNSHKYLNMYSNIVRNIFVENQKAKAYHYNAETRFKHSNYWNSMQTS